MPTTPTPVAMPRESMAILPPPALPLWEPLKQKITPDVYEKLGQPQSRLVKVGQGWSRLVKVGQGWSRLVKVGQGWSRLVKVSQAWSKMKQLIF
jgi:hypothetical protein